MLEQQARLVAKGELLRVQILKFDVDVSCCRLPQNSSIWLAGLAVMIRLANLEVKRW